MTGFASVDTAVEAVKLGAMDYLTKPFDFGRLEQLLASVRDEIERRQSVLSIEGELARRLEFCGMIGRAPRMQDLFGMIRRLAPHVRLALITGETGTGKELVARALFSLGPRRERRFIAVNCSAVNDTTFESELFGHVRGGFLGASDSKPGLFELADGGTLFLDEIGGLPPTAQAKLLRVLELGRGDPGRRPRPAARRRPRHCRHQQGPARRGRGRTLPRRSLLPPQHRRGEAAAAARAARGHSLPDGGVRPGDRRAAAEAAARADARRRRSADRVVVGRQRSRAAQRHRARLHPRRRRVRHRARARGLPAAGRHHDDARARAGGRGAGRNRHRSARQRRARSHPARPGPHRRQQEGGGADARPEPAGAVPPARTARPVGAPFRAGGTRLTSGPDHDGCSWRLASQPRRRLRRTGALGPRSSTTSRASATSCAAGSSRAATPWRSRATPTRRCSDWRRRRRRLSSAICACPARTGCGSPTCCAASFPIPPSSSPPASATSTRRSRGCARAWSTI